MKLSNILKEFKACEFKDDLSLEVIKFTVKKYPLSFWEYCQIKALEGREFEMERGKVVGVKGAGKYDPEFLAQRLYYGLESWELLDDKGYHQEVSLENCADLVNSYPRIAQAMLKEVESFNAPIDQDDKKK